MENERRPKVYGKAVSLENYVPTPDDLEMVAQLDRKVCPRRYCWFWRTLRFDWDLLPSEGCGLHDQPLPPFWNFDRNNKNCKRADTTAVGDYYESRPQILEEDGLPFDRFSGRKVD